MCFIQGCGPLSWWAAGSISKLGVSMHKLMIAASEFMFRGTGYFFEFSGSLRPEISRTGSFVSATSYKGQCRRSVNTCALAICFLLGLCFSVAAQSSSAETLEAQAYIWMQRGRADKAAEVWRKLLLSEPQNATALSELAVQAVTVGASSQAQLHLSELQEADPQDGRIEFVRAILRESDQVVAELRKARLLSKAGRPQAALQHYWKAFGETEPTTLSGLEYYQVLAATPDGRDAALAGLKRLSEIYPKAAHVQLAFGLNLTYVPSTRIRGINILQKLAGMPAVSNEARAGWRQAVMWLGESPQALPLLRAYVSANPKDKEMLHRLELLGPNMARQEALRQAFKALEAGELDQAEKRFQSTPGAQRDPEALAGLASVAMAREAFAQAAKLLYRSRELAPQRPELWQKLLRTTELWQAIRRADTLRREERLDEAQAILERAAISDAAERYQAVMALVNLQLDRGNLSGARQGLLELMNSPPTEAAGLRWLVSLLLRADLDEQAASVNESLRNIDTSAAFRPEGLRAERLRLGAMQLRQAGDVIAARDALVSAAGLDLRASRVWLDLAYLDLELGNIDEAQRSVEALLKAEPELPEAVLVAALLSEQRGEPERGLELLCTINDPELTSEIEKLRRRLEMRLSAARAVRAFQTGGVSVARMQLSALEKAAPGSSDRAIVAEAWADIGEVDHAVLLLHTGETASEEAPGVRLQLAALLLRAGRTSEARTVLEGLAAQPGLAPAEVAGLRKMRVGCAVRAADSRRSLGDLAGARRELEPWTGAAPLEPEIANAYGRVLHDAGDCEGAAGQYVRVLKRDPGNLDALQGLTYSALGGGIDPAGTRHVLQQGLQAREGDPRIHLFIARVEAFDECYATSLEELAEARRLVEDEMHSVVALSFKDRKTSGPLFGVRQTEAELENLLSEIQSETRRVRAASGPKIKPEMTMRSRQGEPGRHAMFELRAPVRLEFPNSWGTLSLQATPIRLSAGKLTLDGDPGSEPIDTIMAPESTLIDTVAENEPTEIETFLGAVAVPFGTVEGATGEYDIEAEGVAVGLEYAYRGWQLDLGVTPVNFARPTIVGGLRWTRAFGDLALTLEASRRAMEESVLSFAGISDPGSGRVWGAVVKQGWEVVLRHDGRNTKSYAVLDYKYLNGTNVKPNHSLAAHLGLRWEMHSTRSTRLETGIAVSAMGFERNLSEFTFGHGGYFSPQRFVHTGLPIDWRGSYQAMTWRLNLEPGVTWFQMDEASYYPLSANSQLSKPTTRYPGRESLGLGFDGGLELGYVLTPQMSLGAKAELHTGDDYGQISAGAFLRFALKGDGDGQRESERGMVEGGR